MYPTGIRSSFVSNAFDELSLLGNRDALSTKLLGLFCSIRCPGDLVLQTYSLAQQLRDLEVATISGFHSPMEQECLRILLRGNQPIVICPARSLEAMRLPAEWKKGIESGRLLLVSAFQREKRAIARLADLRNRLVAGLAQSALFIHAAPGSKTESLCREIVGHRLTLTLDRDSNANLTRLGAQPINVEDVRHLLPRWRTATN